LEADLNYSKAVNAEQDPNNTLQPWPFPQILFSAFVKSTLLNQFVSYKRLKVKIETNLLTSVYSFYINSLEIRSLSQYMPIPPFSKGIPAAEGQLKWEMV